jgi:Swiss Army Knife RNA repair-like protein
MQKEHDGSRSASRAMKVIFLDIDGVLNCHSTPNPRGFPYVVDKRLLRRLKTLMRRTGAKIVLTSSWRVDPIGLHAARYWGVPFMDVCPDFPNSPRRKEILTWLKRHPRVTRHVVIDDDDDELDKLPLFQPSARTGLTPSIAKGVERYLCQKTDEIMRAGVLKRAAQNVTSLLSRDKD